MVGRKVFIPLDLSKHSERAVNWYMNNAHKKEDYIYLFHSVEMPPIPYMGSAVDRTEAIARKSKEIEGLKKFADAVLKSGQGEFLAEEPHFIAIGEHVVKAAKHRHVDVIVIGSRGQGMVRRTLLGSVSDYVLHHVSLPVIIVPPEHNH